MNDMKFVHNGLSCEVVLTSMGYHCGYVEVPSGHRLHGIHYTDKVEVPQEIRDRPVSIETTGAINLLCADIKGDENEIDLVLAIDVHGGLTYSAKSKEGDGWLFGFDCAHAGDARSPEGNEFGGVWRDADYVAEHCRALADQLQSLNAKETPIPD